MIKYVVCFFTGGYSNRELCPTINIVMGGEADEAVKKLAPAFRPIWRMGYGTVILAVDEAKKMITEVFGAPGPPTKEVEKFRKADAAAFIAFAEKELGGTVLVCDGCGAAGLPTENGGVICEGKMPCDGDKVLLCNECANEMAEDMAVWTR